MNPIIQISICRRTGWPARGAISWLVCLLVSVVLCGQTDQRNPVDQIEVPSVILKLVSDVDVPAREAGVIESIEVAPGDRIKVGQLLARIDDQHNELLRDRARLELDIAKATAESDIQIREAQEELQVAEQDLLRGQQSVDRFSRSLSESEIDQLKLEVERAKLKLESARLENRNAEVKRRLSENQLAVAEAAIERHEIRSPLEGVVEEVGREAGEWVEPGDKVLRVIAIQSLRAEGFLSANFASPALLGKPVRLSVTLPDGQVELFPGVVRHVSQEIDPVNQQVRFWAEVDNSRFLLRPGRRARLTIDLASSSQTAVGD